MKSERKFTVKHVRNHLKDPGDFSQKDLRLLDVQALEEERTMWQSFSYGIRSSLAVIICLVIPAIWYFDLSPLNIAGKTTKALAGLFEDAQSIPSSPRIAPTVAPGLTNGGVIDYLSQLQKIGLQDKLSMPAVRAFYENGVPVAYLQNLQETHLLETFSFPAVVAFNQSSVPLRFLKDLRQAGLLKEFSFPAIVAFYQNHIPIAFLQQLKKRNLLKSRSFPAIVSMYQAGSNGGQ